MFWKKPLFVVLSVLVLVSAATIPAVAQEEQAEPQQEDPSTPPPVFDPLTGKMVQREAPPDEGSEAAGEEVVPRADLTEANELLLKGKLEELEGMLANLQGEFPEDPAVLLMRGEVLLALQQVEPALEVLKEGAELDPDRPRMQFQLGSALLATGDTEAALVAFGKEIEVSEDPDVLLLAHMNRSMVFFNEKEWAASAEELEAVLVLSPGRGDIYGDLASSYMLAEEFDKAGEALERGRAAGFQSAAHYYSLGARLCNKDQYEPGSAAFTAALEIDPSMAKAERSLAKCLEDGGQIEAAIEHLRKYLELAPEAKDADTVTQKIELLQNS